MGLEIQTVETTVGQPLLSQDILDQTELLQDIQMRLQVATGEAVDRAMGYADKLSQELLGRVKAQLAGFTRPQERILCVKVDDVARKLTKPASPYLGEAMLQAKCGLNTLLVGPAGCGKTTLAEQVAEGLGLRYGHISLTQGASETWLVGRWTPSGVFVTAEFVDFFENGGVFLIDEIDASDANLLLLINTALANGTLYNPMNGKKHQRHKDFVCIGAANTFGKGGNMVYTGRSRLDGACLNRFAVGVIEMEYSDEIEKTLCPDSALRKKLVKARKFLKDKQSTEMITTRELMNAYTLKCQGVTEERIFQKITASWPKELTEQSKLFTPTVEVIEDEAKSEELPF